MKRNDKEDKSLSKQVKATIKNKKEKSPVYKQKTMISTGSTLLDLAISGGAVRGGGIQGGIFMEVSGPESCGKSVLLAELAGAIQRQGGTANFKDPEGTLDASFAAIFGMKFNEKEYSKPNIVSQVFDEIRVWEPENADKINGIFVDSLAALSTKLEMENPDGDKMGARRGKEFSEGFRKTCRLLNEKNWLMCASNQIRDKIGVTFGKKTDTPGGHALKFYASIRLEFTDVKKIYKEIKVHGQVVKKPIGVEATVKVIKNKVWKPFRTAPILIIFDYGIDDIRANLQYIKKYTTNKIYTAGGIDLDNSLEKSIKLVEEQNLECVLKEQVIDLWEEIESKFEESRKLKER